MIVGAGGLGVPAALSLVRAGIRKFGLVDPDSIELSNLPRQIIFGESDIGVPKVIAAARRLNVISPGIAIESIRASLDAANAAEIISRFDFVIDATDNPATKFLINDVCVELGQPFVYGGVLGLTGQAMTVMPRCRACLRCLFEEPPDEAEVASCREAGIIGPVAGAIGEAQAAEALSFVNGRMPADYHFPTDKLKNQADVLRFAADLERGAVSAYLGAVPLFQSRDLAKASASILGDEAMHWAILRQALGEAPVPDAFVS